MTEILALLWLVCLVGLRHWLYHGRGRWISVPPPRNVVYLDDWRKK